jgi:hypothetical protein
MDLSCIPVLLFSCRIYVLFLSQHNDAGTFTTVVSSYEEMPHVYNIIIILLLAGSLASDGERGATGC